MSILTFKPIILSDRSPIILDREYELQSIFYDNIYKELTNIAQDNNLNLDIKLNSYQDIIEQAIAQEKIIFDFSKNRFTGNISLSLASALKKAGGKFDGTGYVFNDVPQKYMQRVAINRNKIKDFAEKSLLFLAGVNAGKIAKQVSNNSYDLIDQFVRHKIDEDAGASNDIGFFAKRNIKNTNYDLTKIAIKNFTDKQIVDLRKQIAELNQYGTRTSEISKVLIQNYDLSQNRAKFIANQESNMLVAQYTRSRFEASGFNKYIWNSIKDRHCRPIHRLLDGKEIYFTSPPIVDEKGNRKHAGEDFGCRCYMTVVRSRG